MASSAENLAKLQDAFRRWDTCKGTESSMWTDLFAENVRICSLAGGAPGMEFTLECRSLNDVARYFAGLAQDWEMIHYTTEPFAVDGDRIVMRGSMEWRNRKTGRVVETSKVDLVTFRDGRIVEFFELYDTEKALGAART